MLGYIGRLSQFRCLRPPCAPATHVRCRIEAVFPTRWPINYTCQPSWQQRSTRINAAAASVAEVIATSVPQQLSQKVLTIAGDLPIRECLADVLHGLDTSSNLVLQAPPGAGKTTAVPLALLEHAPAYLKAKVVLVLEPRRVAAKSAAQRMASLLGERVGGTVGYRVRLDTQVSQWTRIEVVTEGVLLRQLQRDPALKGVGAILFDEFHERNLDADLCLALCLELQALARPELRLVVMSATLGGGLGERVQALMSSTGTHGTGGASAAATATATSVTSVPPVVPLVVSQGRSFPVRTVYLGKPGGNERQRLERAAADAVLRVLRPSAGGGGGDVLVFLPGVREIQAVRTFLHEAGVGAGRGFGRGGGCSGLGGVRVLPLHGSLSPDAQDQAIRPDPGGARRVVLSTPIAESSVTIDGVTTVIDSGLRRTPAYDARTGVNRLDLTTISQASADQRRGRAGRTAPGACYRLWSSSLVLDASTQPEIVAADLAPAALELALWGDPGGTSLRWLDAPDPARIDDAITLLGQLGAVDDQRRVTRKGRHMARLGVHPRFAHMVLRGAALGFPEVAAVLAALLSERDILRGTEAAARSADIAVRLDALAREDGTVDRHATWRIIQTAQTMSRQVAFAKPSSATGGGQSRSAMGAAPPQTSAGTDSSGDTSDDGGELQDADLASELEGESEESDGASRRDRAQDTGAVGTSGGGRWGGQDSSPAAVFAETWKKQRHEPGLVGALLALAYPDRIARRTESDGRNATFMTSTGVNVRLPIKDDPLEEAQHLAIADLGGDSAGGNDIIYLAASLTRLTISKYLQDLVQVLRVMAKVQALRRVYVPRLAGLEKALQVKQVVFWASNGKGVLARRQERLGALLLREEVVPVDDALALPAVLQGFKELGGVSNLVRSRDLQAWRQRAIWLRGRDVATSSGGTSSLPDLSDSALNASTSTWLAPHLAGVRNKSDLLKLDWGKIIRALVPRPEQQRVEAEAPSHYTAPSGTRVPVDYSREPPAVSVRMQEMYGLATSPSLAGGRVTLAVELLSPASRPLQARLVHALVAWARPDCCQVWAQVTADLAGFWQGSYKAIQQEMKGRYPRHYWPDDPLRAEPLKGSIMPVEVEAAAMDALTTAGKSKKKKQVVASSRKGSKGSKSKKKGR